MKNRTLISGGGGGGEHPTVHFGRYLFWIALGFSRKENLKFT